MNKIIVGIVAILILVAVAIGAIAYLGTDILPNNNDDTNGTESNEIQFGVPDPWYVQSTDAKLSDIAYTILEIPVTYTGDQSYYFSTYINNIFLSDNLPLSKVSGGIARVRISSVSPGEKTLTVKITEHGTSEVNPIAQRSITIIIPDEWKYYYTTVGKADTGEGISRLSGASWIGMSPPMNGVITRISGKIYVDLLGNQPCEIWINMYNKCSGQWANQVNKISANGVNNGWLSIDLTNSANIKTSWWSIAGCAYSDGTAYNTVREFTGYIYMIPGTFDCSINPINIILGLFPADKNISPAPLPCSSC